MGSTRSKKRNRGAHRKLSLFDAAVELVARQIEWIRWDSQSDINLKITCSALSILYGSPHLYNALPEVRDFFESKYLQHGGKDNCMALVREFTAIAQRIRLDSTAFIKEKRLTRAHLMAGWEKYQQVDILLAILGYVICVKPCCRLYLVAGLIPSISRGVPAIGLVSDAAASLAELMNDPGVRFEPDCIRVGNAWFHRLGIYLLHHCHESGMAPPAQLVRLMALVSAPPTASVKGGKAARTHDFLVEPGSPLYLHQTPPAVVAGNLLALELLGEVDANRQEEYFLRVQRAVALFSWTILHDGKAPSIYSIKNASGLSWADSRSLVERPYFRLLVFEYQCQYLKVLPHVRNCANCKRIAGQLEADALKKGI